MLSRSTPANHTYTSIAICKCIYIYLNTFYNSYIFEFEIEQNLKSTFADTTISNVVNVRRQFYSQVIPIIYTFVHLHTPLIINFE